MNPLARLRFWLAVRLRRPIRIHLAAPPDNAAAALHGLASLLARRGDMTGRRLRIDLTIHPPRPGKDNHR